MPRNMVDAIPLTLWIIEMESAWKDLGERLDLGRMAVLSILE